VVISAVDGAAGIGKTTLAVHWAHRVQHHFPDGTLHANLRGYGPGAPATPDEVLDGFLRALDVSEDRIPAELDARSALFRSVLANRRITLSRDIDERAAVRAVFGWSYHQLTEEQARMFGRLGLHPGPDLSLHAAAALAGRSLAETRDLMDRLTAVHMIEPIARDRYRFHDLLRAYAADLARQDSDSLGALKAFLDWYILTAHTCGELVYPYSRPRPIPPHGQVRSRCRGQPRPRTRRARPVHRSTRTPGTRTGASPRAR
jgi:hypothetical protein